MATKRIVEWRRPNFHNVGGLFKLNPGVNEVEEALVEKALEIELFRWYVDEGWIKLGKVAPQSLAKLKPAEALELVAKTVDKDLLGRWFDAEKRKPVQDALLAQIAAITPNPEGEKDEKKSQPVRVVSSTGGDIDVGQS